MTDTMTPQRIPGTYRRVTPCLVVGDVARALEFYAGVFGARERARLGPPGGPIVHAEIEIGDSVVIVNPEDPRDGTVAPPPDGLPGSPAFQFVYVEDVDAVVARAVELGATLVRPAQDQFYGDRDGFVVDPFGHGWTIASHVEDVGPEELGRRMAAVYGPASEKV
jgi:PhnB protein